MPGLGLGTRLERTRKGGTAVFPRPSNLVIVTSGTTNDRTIDLSWIAPTVRTPDDYLVQLSTDGVAWSNDQTITHPTVEASYTGLADGVYYVRVRANYSSGSSGWLSSGSIILSGGLLPVINWGFFF